MRYSLPLLFGLLAAVVTAPTPARADTGDAPVAYHRWASARDFAAGAAEGVAVSRTGELVIARPAGRLEYRDPSLHTRRTYEYARWTTPWHAPGFAATQLVASWNADTPAGTWLQVELRGHTRSGAETKWYVMGRWAYGDADIHRTSVPGQADEHGDVDVDTFKAAPGSELTGYQLRVTLFRPPGVTVTPRVRLVGAMASAVPDRFDVPASRPGVAAGIELPVPRYSQEVHRDEYPEYDGGGEAWCSPTSTAMVVEYWGRGPSPEEVSWVDPSYPDPVVDHAARMTYDYAYEGAGNWPFNAAYAAHFGLVGEITRLHSLPELERFIRAGIPVITSQSFRADELDGAGYGTAGHIMVVVGFTRTGDVIVNDPAAPTDAAVRKVYPRRQFETVWLRTKRVTSDGGVASGSGGIVYLIRPRGMPLPPGPGNW